MRLYYAIRPATEGDAGQAACGQASFMDVDARNGIIEIGHIWFGPNLQRTRGATEALIFNDPPRNGRSGLSSYAIAL